MNTETIYKNKGANIMGYEYSEKFAKSGLTYDDVLLGCTKYHRFCCWQ